MEHAKGCPQHPQSINIMGLDHCTCRRAFPKIQMREYSHPEWDMTLFTEEKDGDQIALDMLGEGNGDPDLLTFTECEMTREEIDALPEFDG